MSVGDVQSVWLNESSGQTPLINSLRKTLEKDQEWLDNESSESMFTQTTSDYVAQDCINALATPNQTYTDSDCCVLLLPLLWTEHACWVVKAQHRLMPYETVLLDTHNLLMIASIIERIDNDGD